jgi:hypothetical protein
MVSVFLHSTAASSCATMAYEMQVNTVVPASVGPGNLARGLKQTEKARQSMIFCRTLDVLLVPRYTPRPMRYMNQEARMIAIEGMLKIF